MLLILIFSVPTSFGLSLPMFRVLSSVVLSYKYSHSARLPRAAHQTDNGHSVNDCMPDLNLGNSNCHHHNNQLSTLQIFNSTAYEYWPSWNYRRAEYIGKAWDLFFRKTELGEMPDRLRMALVQEFFVRRERIQLRSRQFYLQAIQWVADARRANEFTDWEITTVFELLWHYMFGEPAFMPGLTVKPCTLYRCEGDFVAESSANVG